jgi:hypothetical protein
MAPKTPISYRLQVSVEPQWAEIIKRVVGFRDEHEQRDFGTKLRDHLSPDRLLHRKYDFTEFFDSQSGLTIKYQRVSTPDTTYGFFVREFCDAGHLFGWNNPLTPKEDAEKLELAISEDSIRTHCFDPHTGRRNTMGPALCTLPLNAIVEFGVTLHRKLELNTNYVLRWSDEIEAALRKANTKYIHPDAPLAERKIEKKDHDFFTRYGHPKLAKYESWPAPYFENPCCYYSVDLQVFTPETARWSSRLYDYFKEED